MLSFPKLHEVLDYKSLVFLFDEALCHAHTRISKT